MADVVTDGHAGGDLYRALQDHKTDDVGSIRRVVAEQERSYAGTDRPRVIDLCSGVGRTVHLYPATRWRLTCVDSDADALDALVARRPDATAVRAIIGSPVDAGTAHLVVCAHNSANEVDDPLALVDTAARMTAVNGALYLDLIVGDRHYPAAYLRETVRELSFGGLRWLFHTVVLPGASTSRHTLLLVGEQMDAAAGERPRRVIHHLHRRVPTADEIIARAVANGLTLSWSEQPGRYVFRRLDRADTHPPSDWLADD